MADASTAALPAVRPGSFYSAPPHEVWRREEVACAQLGLTPGAGAFESCLSEMRTTFYAINNPQS
jgi:hypothetical protein